MDKTAIKRFATSSRMKMREMVQAGLAGNGIYEDGIREELPASTVDVKYYDSGSANPVMISGKTRIDQRRETVEKLTAKAKDSDYATAYNAMVEHVASAWFNRLIAIRFMEVNDYLSDDIYMLSSREPGKKDPDIITQAFESDLEFTDDDRQEIMNLKKKTNADDALFWKLLKLRCNQYSQFMPGLFEKKDNYTEALISLSFTDQDGVVNHLINDIPVEDWQDQVQIIGWMYQYYNSDLKDETFKLLKNKQKITKERIPSATQLFTPDWIVRYMVENSLGRIWYEGHQDDSLKETWKYYIDEAEQEPEVQAQLDEERKKYAKLNPEDLTFIDPSMGSGHILVYAFDVLMQIYLSVGYTEEEAAESIIENNLYGLDIDERAYELAYFAVLMKAKQYGVDIFDTDHILNPHVYAIVESNEINSAHLQFLGNQMEDTAKRNKTLSELKRLLEQFKDAKIYGSIIKVADYDFEVLRNLVDSTAIGQTSIDSQGIEETQKLIKRMIDIAEVMHNKYWIAVTNPPYRAVSDCVKKLENFTKKYYPDTKNDLYAVFMEVCVGIVKSCGKCAMITQQTWMFTPTYISLREKVSVYQIDSLLHLWVHAFDEIKGEVVQTVAFVMTNIVLPDYMGKYYNLTTENGEKAKRDKFLYCPEVYISCPSLFTKIDKEPFAYWASKDVVNAFVRFNPMSEYGDSRSGMQTGDNNKFMRLWPEVEYEKIGFHNSPNVPLKPYKWIQSPKGGTYRKWYGNLDYLVNYENDGEELKNFTGTSIIKNPQYYFRKGITWSHTSTASFAARYMPEGCIFNVEAPSLYLKDENEIPYFLGALNTNITDVLFGCINKSLHYLAGDMQKIPIPLCDDKLTKDRINCLSERNVSRSKSDWDSYETSWDFKRSPLIPQLKIGSECVFIDEDKKDLGSLNFNSCKISDEYENWKQTCNSRFDELKKNEEELNRIFIDIYGLQDELTPEESDKDVTVHRVYDTKADVPESMKDSNYVRTKRDEIVSLISYAVGCMLGRYSLDVDGLAYAGGDWDASKYKTFMPDEDNIIPITDAKYLEDDIVDRFSEWLVVVYGRDTLEENMRFIADALDGMGDTPKEVIRNYFLNDFFKDHCSTYSVTGSGKRPIYWLFDSGKQNAFKCLVYMHRWNKDTIARVRTLYVHKIQERYDNAVRDIDTAIASMTNDRMKAQEERRKEKLIKQIKELKKYDEKLEHLAAESIDIDLDDGVKVNHEKVQTDHNGKKYQILAKI